MNVTQLKSKAEAVERKALKVWAQTACHHKYNDLQLEAMTHWLSLKWLHDSNGSDRLASEAEKRAHQAMVRVGSTPSPWAVAANERGVG